MLKRIRFVFLTAPAFGILFGLASSICDAQNKYDPYDKVRVVLDEYERKDVDYGVSENEDWQKARKLGNKYGDLIREALGIILREEMYSCHLGLQCKKDAQEKYELSKKSILEAWKAVAVAKFGEIRKHYDEHISGIR